MNNLTEQEISALKEADSDEEWNRLCDEIKASHGGQYPADWYEVVILGELNQNLDFKLE